MSEANRPHLLLTNDDGIEAPGLAALAEALRPHADLTIVAPRVENSGMGHAISVFKDLHFEPIHRDGSVWGWGLAGTPADCVKVAATVFGIDRPFDYVFSGINCGQNAGINILYSGTVAAAREATVLGIPAIAVSLLYHDLEDLPFQTAGRVAVDVLAMVQSHRLPPRIMLNVNVPPIDYEAIEDWCVTRMGNAGYEDYFLHQPAAADQPAIYRNVGKGWVPSEPKSEDTDDHALYANRVSITPLQFDLTAYDFMEPLQNWIPRKQRGSEES